MAGKLSVAAVNALGRDEFVGRFGPLFEYSSWVAGEAWERRPFEDLEELRRAFEAALYGASRESKLALIRAHPDLAGKAAVAGELTEESGREQASAGLDRLTRQEFEEFTRINRAYHEKFGMPMVVCVRGHTKRSILEGAVGRLENAREEEIETALAEISKISGFRLRDLVVEKPKEREKR